MKAYSAETAATGHEMPRKPYMRHGLASDSSGQTMNLPSGSPPMKWGSESQDRAAVRLG